MDLAFYIYNNAVQCYFAQILKINVLIKEQLWQILLKIIV